MCSGPKISCIVHAHRNEMMCIRILDCWRSVIQMDYKPHKSHKCKLLVFSFDCLPHKYRIQVCLSNYLYWKFNTSISWVSIFPNPHLLGFTTLVTNRTVS